MAETPEKALEKLLNELFTVEQLRRFLSELPGAWALVDELPSAPASAAEVNHHAVAELRREGRVDQVHHEASPLNEKLIPVLLEAGSEDHIPLALKPHTRYRLPAGYDDLLRHLTGQPAVVPQTTVSAGCPATRASGAQTIINHGTVAKQVIVQGKAVFNFGRDDE